MTIPIFSALYNLRRTTVSYKKPDGTGEEIIVLDATITEGHNSTLDVTSLPIEDGFDITDHAQIKPRELTLEAVISDTPITLLGSLGGLAAGGVGWAVGASGATVGARALAIGANAALAGAILSQTKARVQDVYNCLLDIQKKKILLCITTGLQVYNNMILQGLNAPRDENTGKSLKFTAVLKEVIIVQSQKVILPKENTKNKGAVPSQNLGTQTPPAATSAIASKGQSILAGVFSFFGF